MSSYKKVLLVPAVVSAAALIALGAVAYACTGASGSQTYSSPNSGSRNSSLEVETWAGGTSLAQSTPGFYFRYRAPGSSTACHHSATIGASVTSTAFGSIGTSSSKYTRTIPDLGATAGTGEACWATGSMITNEIANSATMTVN